MQKSYLKYLLFLFILFFPIHSFAQMFSVDSEYERQTNPFTPYLRVGIQPVNLEFTGDPSALQQAPLSFSGNLGEIGIETGGFDLGLTFGNDFTGLDERKFFSLALKFSNTFYLIRQPRFGLGTPLQLGTKLTSVRSDEINSEFSQTNLHAGAGFAGILFFPDKLSLTASIIPSFGFSTASGGLIGGNVFSWRGRARLNFFNVIFGRNISLGYDYIFDSYDIDGEEYDYDLSGHSLTLGISL